METTGESVMVDQAALNEMEERAVRVNGALLRMKLAIDRGDMEAIANLRALAQELNWTNRRALLGAGAIDSILRAAGVSSYTADADDHAGADYDLGNLGEWMERPGRAE